VLRTILLLALTAASLPAADWTDLMPPADLKGWTRVPIPPVPGADPKLQWRVDTSKHELICAGNGQHEWLRSDTEYGNFILQVEWRFTAKEGNPRYNSGIGVRLSKYGEIWFQAQTGQAGGYWFGDNIVDGAIKRFNLSKQMKENRVKPAGEWNLYEIRAEGDKLSLSINGGMVSETAGVVLQKGYIGLEAEGHEITFRTVKLKPLE
jgi:3-keto-disaccharide hydrolase